MELKISFRMDAQRIFKRLRNEIGNLLIKPNHKKIKPKKRRKRTYEELEKDLKRTKMDKYNF